MPGNTYKGSRNIKGNDHQKNLQEEVQTFLKK